MTEHTDTDIAETNHDEVNGEDFTNISENLSTSSGMFYAAKMMAQMNYHLTVNYWKSTFTTWKSRKWWMKILLIIPVLILCIAWTLSRILATLITPIMFPAMIVITTITVSIVVDQVTYPSNIVDPIFTEASNKDLSENEKVALLFKAATHQMKKELNSTLGWCPNDLVSNPIAYLDNRCKRQLGVWYGTYQAVTELSVSTTKFGMGDTENANTKLARTTLAYGPEKWGWLGTIDSASERQYDDGLKALAKFYEEAQSATNSGDVIVDIRSDDMHSILDVLTNDKRGILSEPWGGLKDSSASVTWSELDDNIYYAQGAAIVTRDILATLKSCFPQEMDRGGIDVLDAAIKALNSAAKYNPYIITAGDGDTIWVNFTPDHRSKMSRYYANSVMRIKELQKSLQM